MKKIETIIFACFVLAMVVLSCQDEGESVSLVLEEPLLALILDQNSEMDELFDYPPYHPAKSGQGNAESLWRLEVQALTDWNEIVVDDRFAHQTALRVGMHYDDITYANGRRPRVELSADKYTLENGHTYRIDFEFGTDDSFAIERENNAENIFQLHQKPSDAEGDFDANNDGKADQFGNPPVSLRMYGQADEDFQKLYVIVKSSQELRQTEENTHTDTIAHIADIAQNSFYQFSIIYKSSSEPDGYLEITVNGEQKFLYHGANDYLNEDPEAHNFLKFGLYKWNWGKEPTSLSERFYLYNAIGLWKLD